MMAKSQGKRRINPLKICFPCGRKIKNRMDNALMCKGCSKIKSEIQDIINTIVYNRNLKLKFKGYTFKVNIDLVKVRNG